MESLSKIIAGTMSWGVWDKKLTTSQMAHLIRLCVENQVTTFDHADIYGGYTTEAEFGKSFKSSGMKRSQIQLISKCGIQYIAKSRNNRVKHYDYRKEYIIESVETSLKHLQTDYLDVFLLHRPSPLMIPDEIAGAVEVLKKAGKIRDFGVSNFTSSQVDLLRTSVEVSYNQIQFSATHYLPMIDGSLDYMMTHSIRPMAWNPLGTVFRENTEQTKRLKTVLARLVDKYHAGSDILLLSWILQHPAGIIPLAGTVNSGRIQQLHKATEIILDTEDWFEIWVESMGHKVP